MGWKEFEDSLTEAGKYNVKTAVGFLVKGGTLPEGMQPAIRIMAERVVRVASERKVEPMTVFDEVVSGRDLAEAYAMGGTDHCDPTLHSSPIEAER